MKQVEVQIMGQSYLLNCPEGGETSLQHVVGRVDKAMCRIRDAGKVKARDRIAVLAALNLAFEEEGKADVASPQPSAVKATETASAPAASDSSMDAALLALASRIDSVLEADGQLL
ncbi:MAG: cell division protein ZapA [Betaproteobacteria bacterium]|jgi:cell division protein ZapA|nr:cell division protein ZapA [Betaproteobacteria bacterium]